ncbi:hypothetical protein OSB04_002966 [Centaurea solstitialis]|uniref:Uncharacterized protein n=1 Tax=Centaurea solstitialis TaxID=347529 RepID=A0AA38TTY7_9ASTR|nr:hypothetical protein OSB04_002966 [Centaurea solstitialis]
MAMTTTVVSWTSPAAAVSVQTDDGSNAGCPGGCLTAVVAVQTAATAAVLIPVSIRARLRLEGSWLMVFRSDHYLNFILNCQLGSGCHKDKLTGANFLDWECNLMIVLRHERKWYVLKEPLSKAPPANAAANVRNAYRKHSDDLLDVGCLMLATMSPDLQTRLIDTNAYDMIRQLRDMFQTQART